MNVALRPEASADLVSAAAYFNDISECWGDHFLDRIEVDLADLRNEAGIHAAHYGLSCKFSKAFPFAIYYRVETDSAMVYAILSCRMSPEAHKSILDKTWTASGCTGAADGVGTEIERWGRRPVILIVVRE